MQKVPNKRMIGLFLLVGIASFLFIIIFLTKNFLFANRGKEVVMFFNESISGLNVGSSVVFEGVKVGEVIKIDIITNPETLAFSIPVYVRMFNSSIISRNKYHSDADLLNALIKKGLRARLASQSFVTGQLMIEMGMFPDTKVVYHADLNRHNILEIPTILSQLGEISRSIQKLPIQEGVENFTEFFKSLNQVMPRVNKIVADIEKVVNKNSSSSGAVLNNLNNATISVTRAAKSMQNLTDYLEEHPEAILKGKR